MKGISQSEKSSIAFICPTVRMFVMLHKKESFENLLPSRKGRKVLKEGKMKEKDKRWVLATVQQRDRGKYSFKKMSFQLPKISVIKNGIIVAGLNRVLEAKKSMNQ